LLDLDASFAARLQRRAGANDRFFTPLPPVTMPGTRRPPGITRTPYVLTPAAASAFASPGMPLIPAAVDWTAQLHAGFLESHLGRLERRQLNNPYSKVTTRKESLNAFEQKVHDLRRSNDRLAKEIMWTEEENEHLLKCDKRNWDATSSRLEEAIEHRKRRKVVDAWRDHILPQRKWAGCPQQRRQCDQLLKEGPPPGWTGGNKEN
jgi:hypothetical protein